MISEVVNSLFLTYLASEYLVAEDHPSVQRNKSRTAPRNVLTKRTLPLAAVVLLVNALDHLAGAKLDFVYRLFQSFMHLPKVLFAASAYVCALFVDIFYVQKVPLLMSTYLRKVGWAFCKILPAYPLMAVLMSFVFLFVINIWEALHLPMEWLNAPIYYGTLYGPFAWVYVYVKRQVCEEATSLPV
jgi:hypothetical protein